MRSRKIPEPHSLPPSSERAHWARQPPTAGHLAAAISSFGLHAGAFVPTADRSIGGPVVWGCPALTDRADNSSGYLLDLVVFFEFGRAAVAHGACSRMPLYQAMYSTIARRAMARSGQA